MYAPAVVCGPPRRRLPRPSCWGRDDECRSRRDRRRRPHRADRRDPARPVRRRVPGPGPVGVGLPAAPGRPPRRRGLPHPGPPRAARRVRRDLPALPRVCGSSTGHAGARRVPARHRRRAGTATPRRTCSTSRSWRRILRANLARYAVRHPARQHRGHRADPGRPAGVRVDVTDRATGARRRRPRRVRARLRRRQQPDPRRDRRQHAATCTFDAALARRRRRHRRPTSASGKACTRCATRPAPAPTCGSATTRYRWEFRLTPGETADDFRDIDPAAPAHRAVDRRHPASTELQIVRVAEYTFRAQIADRWRDRRVFLLGDAAHLTPPFIGQGMGAGLRDAANLAWKLAGVLGGNLARDRAGHLRDRTQAARPRHDPAGEADRYGHDRPAAKSGNRLRRAGRATPAPPARRSRTSSSDSRTPPLRRSDLVVRPRLRRSLGRAAVPERGPRRPTAASTTWPPAVSPSSPSIAPSPAQRAEIERRGAVLDHRPTGQRTAPMAAPRPRPRRRRPPRRHRSPCQPTAAPPCDRRCPVGRRVTESSAAPAIVLVFCVSYQQVENHLLQPAITSHAVQLNPPIVLVSVLAAAEPGGIGGHPAGHPGRRHLADPGGGTSSHAGGRPTPYQRRPAQPTAGAAAAWTAHRASTGGTAEGRAAGTRGPPTGHRPETDRGADGALAAVTWSRSPIPRASAVDAVARRSSAHSARAASSATTVTFTMFAIQYDSWPTLAWSR